MTNSFNYLREPDSDGMFDSNYTRQSQNLKQITDSSLKDLDAAIKNEETDSKFLEGLESFSTGINDLLVKRREKKDKDDLAKAQLAVRRGDHDPDKDRKLEQARSEEVGQTKVVNDAAERLKQRDGNSSILAQELYERDSSYRAKVHIVQLQERTRETGQRLEAAKETLKIAGVDGEELSYDQIRKPSDMAAWTAKFEAQDIKNNFGNVSAEGFSLYVNEGYTYTINQHSNTWATNNAKAQKKERLLTESNVIMQSFNSGNFVNAATDALYSKSLTPDQLYDLMLTGIESEAVSQETMAQFMTQVPHTGGGTTTLSKLIGLQNFAKLKKAFVDKKYAAYARREQDRAIAGKQLVRDLEKSVIGGKDPDGIPRATLEDMQAKFINKFGARSPELDAYMEEHSAEAMAKDALLDYDLDRLRNQMESGFFVQSTMKNYPPSIQAKLKAIQSQIPGYSDKQEDNKTKIAELENLVDREVNNTRDKAKAKNTEEFKTILRKRYRGNILAGKSAQEAKEEVENYFEKQLEKKGFKTREGYVGLDRTAKVKAEENALEIERQERGRDLWQKLGKDRESVLQQKNGLYTDQMLINKARDIMMTGKYVPDEFDIHMAALMGYSNPVTMLQDILDRNPVTVKGEPLMIEAPPIFKLAENFETPEQTRLFARDVKGAQQAIASMPDSRNLPVRGVTGPVMQQPAIQQLYIDNGIDPETAKTFAAIGMAESGGQVGIDTVQSGLDTQKQNEYSIGLLQINVQAHADKLARRGWTEEDLRDPVKNAIIAIEVYKEAGNSFSPWSAYTNGMYKQFL